VFPAAVTRPCELLGAQIKQARIEQKCSVRDLANRAGVSPRTLQAVENGGPTVAIGITFQIAALVGVVLYYEDESFLVGELARIEARLALLPKRIRPARAVPGNPGNDDNAASGGPEWAGSVT
jgi:transcriptional regulator with XRE-family HTH domain